MEEEWKQYQSDPSYWVSNLGDVKRIYGRNSKDHVLKPTIKSKGYAKIDLIRKPERV